MFKHTTSMRVRLCAVTALAIAMFAMAAAAAFAAPSGPTYSTTELQAALDANGGAPLEGHMKTVLKGSDIAEIPVRILAVTGGYAEGPDMSALVVFEAYGPEIDRIGGIASGMSGSPLYVENGTDDILVGAVSYGDWFTRNGTGLATPIEAMVAIEDDYGFSPLGIRALDAPVAIGGELKDKVIIAPQPQMLEEAAADGAIVAKPLTSMFLGGLSPASKVYKAYARHLAQNGGGLVPLQSGLSAMQHPYDAEFEAGSAIAALAARGDLWYGGIGTVTYVNGDNVLAFGHPMVHEGETGLFMSNAWIDWVWPSNETPYKLGRPATLRGTITQDRGAGIMGVDGQLGAVTPVTATATKDGKTATSAVSIPRHVMNSTTSDYDGLVPLAAYIAGTRVYDAATAPGSAVTTTTVTVKEGATEHTITRKNIVDDPYNVPAAAMMDVATIVSKLQSLREGGVANPDILSVKVESAMSESRKVATIVDVNVPGGLKTGANTAKVSFHVHGLAATQTVDVPFTIPAGTPLTGELEVSDAYGSPDEGDFTEDELFETAAPVRQTVAQAVAELNAAPTNDTLLLTYYPVDVPSEFDEVPAKPKAYPAITAKKKTSWFVNGYASKLAPRMNILAMNGTVGYRGQAMFFGELLGAESNYVVKVTRKYWGDSTIASLPTVSADPDEGPFDFITPELYKNAAITFSYAGDADTLPSSAVTTTKVKAATSLSSSSYRFRRGKTVTLTAKVTPATTAGKVVFERYYAGSWRSLGTRTLSAGKATLSYKPGSTGTIKLRARYVPGTGATNVASTSSTKTLTVLR